MTSNLEDTIFKDIPETLAPGLHMAVPNEVIPIYKGEFKLVLGPDQVEMVGEIEFIWLPNSGVRFSGKVKNSSLNPVELFGRGEKFKLIINELEFGECHISRTTFDGDVTIGGSLVQRAVRGDRSIPVSKVKFSIPNFRDFLGLSVKEKTRSGKNRIKFENDDYLIVIDKRMDFKEANESLESKGGFLILWNGELTKKRGNILLEDLTDIHHCFSTFLSFLNGRRCSPLFIKGLHDNEEIWTDYSDYFVDQFKSVISWPQAHSIEGLDELWKKFSSLWVTEDGKDFLTSVVHWYIEANAHSGFTEGSIIMAQTGLELIYNWLLIEKQNLLVGKDAENISASNKIRLLLSFLKVNFEVPDSLAQLKEVSDMIDAPEAFVQIRNAIVHSQEEKRKKISKMHYMAKFDALQLGLWYIELAVLKILDFNGVYRNRCIRGVHTSQTIRKVPWAREGVIS